MASTTTTPTCEPSEFASKDVSFFRSGDLVLRNPKESAVIFGVVVILAILFSVVLQYFRRHRSMYVRGLSAILTEQALLMGVIGLMFVFLVHTIEGMPNRWVTIFRWIQTVIFFFMIFFCMGAIIAALAARRKIRFFIELEKRLLDDPSLAAAANHEIGGAEATSSRVGPSSTTAAGAGEDDDDDDETSDAADEFRPSFLTRAFLRFRFVFHSQICLQELITEDLQRHLYTCAIRELVRAQESDLAATLSQGNSARAGEEHNNGQQSGSTAADKPGLSLLEMSLLTPSAQNKNATSGGGVPAAGAAADSKSLQLQRLQLIAEATDHLQRLTDRQALRSRGAAGAQDKATAPSPSSTLGKMLAIQQERTELQQQQDSSALGGGGGVGLSATSRYDRHVLETYCSFGKYLEVKVRSNVLKFASITWQSWLFVILLSTINSIRLFLLPGDLQKKPQEDFIRHDRVRNHVSFIFVVGWVPMLAFVFSFGMLLRRFRKYKLLTDITLEQYLDDERRFKDEVRIRLAEKRAEEAHIQQQQQPTAGGAGGTAALSVSALLQQGGTPGAASPGSNKKKEKTVADLAREQLAREGGLSSILSGRQLFDLPGGGGAGLGAAQSSGANAVVIPDPVVFLLRGDLDYTVHLFKVPTLLVEYYTSIFIVGMFGDMIHHLGVVQIGLIPAAFLPLAVVTCLMMPAILIVTVMTSGGSRIDVDVVRQIVEKASSFDGQAAAAAAGGIVADGGAGGGALREYGLSEDAYYNHDGGGGGGSGAYGDDHDDGLLSSTHGDRDLPMTSLSRTSSFVTAPLQRSQSFRRGRSGSNAHQQHSSPSVSQLRAELRDCQRHLQDEKVLTRQLKDRVKFLEELCVAYNVPIQGRTISDRGEQQVTSFDGASVAGVFVAINKLQSQTERLLAQQSQMAVVNRLRNSRPAGAGGGADTSNSSTMPLLLPPTEPAGGNESGATGVGQQQPSSASPARPRGSVAAAPRRGGGTGGLLAPQLMGTTISDSASALQAQRGVPAAQMRGIHGVFNNSTGNNPDRTSGNSPPPPGMQGRLLGSGSGSGGGRPHHHPDLL